MSSKKVIRKAQTQAYAKYRSNINNSRFEFKKKFTNISNKESKKK